MGHKQNYDHKPSEILKFPGSLYFLTCKMIFFVHQQGLHQIILPKKVCKLQKKKILICNTVVWNINWIEDGWGLNKMRLPHIYKNNTYMSRFSVTSFKNETYFRNKLTAISVTWTEQNFILSQQNSLWFCTDFTQTGKNCHNPWS